MLTTVSGMVGGQLRQVSQYFALFLFFCVKHMDSWTFIVMAGEFVSTRTIHANSKNA